MYVKHHCTKGQTNLKHPTKKFKQNNFFLFSHIVGHVTCPTPALTISVLWSTQRRCPPGESWNVQGSSSRVSAPRWQLGWQVARGASLAVISKAQLTLCDFACQLGEVSIEGLIVHMLHPADVEDRSEWQKLLGNKILLPKFTLTLRASRC